ncbi:MAG TPA: HAMP domain-containing protein, partial [bacterium]|nr:HAMP domain-containing protein [bacterium]
MGRKLAAAVSAVLIVFSLAFVGVLLDLFHRSADDLNESWLDVLTDTVHGSVTAALENDQKQHGDRFQRVVHDAAAGHQEIKAIRIVDMQGKIVFSSLPREAGQSVESALAASLPQVKETAPATPSSPDAEATPTPLPVSAAEGVVLKIADGRLDSLRPIRNEQPCQKCHGIKQAQLGVLQIAVSTRKADQEVARFEKLLGFLAILPLFFVVGTILLFTRYLVYKPLRSLTRTIRKAEEGDFLHRADVPGDDEVAQLAKDFNGMLGRITTLTAMNMERERELAQAQQEMKNRAALDEKAKIINATNRELSERNKELAVLFDLGQRINSTLALEEMFESLTHIVGEKLGYRQFVVLLWDEAKDALVVKTTFGFEEENEIRGMTFKKGEGIAGECMRT